jgi:hypothetical protein
LPSFPALAFFLATVVPQMGFVSTRPSMPDEQSEKSEKKNTGKLGKKCEEQF